MPINIPIGIQQNSPGSDILLYNSWQSDPLPPFEIYHMLGDAMPTAVTVANLIKNYPSVQSNGQYVNFYATKRNPGIVMPGVPVIALIDTTGDIAAAALPGYEILPDTLEVSSVFSFINLDQLPRGTYMHAAYFDVYGETSLGDLVRIDIISFSFKMNIVGPTYISVFPKFFSFNYFKGDTNPASIPFKIFRTGDFRLKIPKEYTVSGGNIAVSASPTGYIEYEGSGDQDLEIVPNVLMDDKPFGTFYDFQFAVGFGGDEVVCPIETSTLVLQDTGVTVTPTALEFTAVKNVFEAEPQNIEVYGPGVFTTTKPDWIVITPSAGQDITSISVQPVLAANFSPGTYAGIVTISLGDTDYEVNVIYNVYENVNLGADPEGINFTDDRNTISDFYATQLFSLQLGLHVNVTSYGINLPSLIDLPLKLGFFNFRSNYFIGKSLNNLMPELRDLAAINLESLANSLPLDTVAFIRNYYNPAVVDLQADFMHQFNEDLNLSYSFSNVSFLKGRKPKDAFAKSAILNYERDLLRVTPNSEALFNFYKEQSHQLRIFKNGELLETVNHNPASKRVFAFKFKFKDHHPGDVIEIRLHRNFNVLPDELWYNDPVNYVSQKYAVIPASDHETCHIVWEDEYGCLECLEFTGSLSFSAAYENNTVLNYARFLETLRKIDGKRTQSLTANTGYIFKQNTKRIDSLLKSSRAWIVSNVSKPIALVPLTKSLSGQDTDRDLYAYDIEFEINPDHDLQSYS